MSNNGRRSGGHTIIAAERRRVILDRIRTGGSVNVSELAREFNVGVTTIRQDLNALDAQGEIIRSHGGAIAKDEARPIPPVFGNTR